MVKDGFTGKDWGRKEKKRKEPHASLDRFEDVVKHGSVRRLASSTRLAKVALLGRVHWPHSLV